MGKNYFNFKNFTTTLLITSFIVMPFYGIPKKVEAQSLGAYVTGLAPAITQLPLCKGKLIGATKSLFTGQFSAAWSALNDKLGNKIGNKIEEKLGDTTSSLAEDLDSIKVTIKGTEAAKSIEKIKEDNKKIQAGITSLDANDTCLKNIGRMVIKMLLQKITVSTVNWINSGFDGKPAFIQNPSKFFEDIAKNEFLQFGAEINNKTLFPFGKAWLINQAEHFNDRFADNARYSLDELIKNTTPQYSAEGFWLNFDQGGWGAWSAMTQYPQNNSLGFQLMASNELQRRLAGTSQSTAQNVREALQAADGFLGDQRCAEPEGVTREEHNRATAQIPKGPRPQTSDFFIPYDAGVGPDGETGQIDMDAYNAAVSAWNQIPEARVCNRWEYVTPGKLIAEAATSTIKYPENNLLKADDLNDAMAAIMDALLSRFSADLMEKGYANLGNDGSDGLLAYAQGSFGGDNTSQTEKDFRPVQLSSSWLSENPNFNIRTDLTQALIDEQRTYIEKLEAQNTELYSTTNGEDYEMGTNGVSNAYGLIPVINQLDYCIPGPHPGWEEDSRRVLDAVTGVIIPETEQSVANKSKEQLVGSAQTVVSMSAPLAGAAIGASAGSAVFPVVGTAIGALVGTIVGFVGSAVIGWLGGDDNAEKVRSYYADILLGLTGVSVNHKGDGTTTSNNISNKQGLVQVLNVMLSDYATLIQKIYNEKVLPSMYRDAVAEYNKLEGYTQIIENNKNTISAMKNVVTILEQVKKNVDDLNRDKDENYENNLQAQISVFGRVSANMVTGDDIASADNLLKQIIDEENYVYNDLLKGPLGCEKELEENNHLPDYLNQTKRANYPFPILYTYDMNAGGNIPDPWNSGFQNKTNSKADNTLGPGFLSYYYFQTDKNETDNLCENKEVDENGFLPQCKLKLTDLLPISGKDQYTGHVGRRLGTIPNTANCENQYKDDNTNVSCSTGSWESTTIRVY